MLLEKPQGRHYHISSDWLLGISLSSDAVIFPAQGRLPVTIESELQKGESTMYETSIELIRERLSDDELLCQLAEECAELAQAALKVRRAMTANNYTPVSSDEARAKFLEECADVLLCLDAIAYF